MEDLDKADIGELQRRLREAEETLDAIRRGEVDALLVADEQGERVYTLRSADAPYRALIEQMQEGAAALAHDGAVIYCNRRFAEMVGAPLQKVFGVSIDRFVSGTVREELRRLLADGTGSLQTTLRGSGARPIDAHISVSSVRLEDETHRTLLVTDVSALTKVERENRSKDEFLAMLSHELRNPLGAITAALQLLQLCDVQDARASHARTVIERQVGHMARLVDDLLQVGRVVTGKIALSRRPVELGGIVRDCVAATSAAHAQRAPIELAVEPAWVSGDSVRLEQIVGNLVSNALKFSTPQQRVSVTLTRDGDEAVLQVRDEGRGIEAELLPRVFELFVQGDSGGARSAGGLGIGLTLVQRLVEAHGGDVTAASAGPGRGAAFTVRLPMCPPLDEAHSGAPVVRPSVSRRVLLVDDNADAREMYYAVLTAAGNEVRTAEDGERALDLVATWKPDIAIVDIGLPTIDGYELARRVRASGQSMALIALTGYGFPEDRERSQAAGFDRHLVKPFSPTSLSEAIEATLAATRRGTPDASTVAGDTRHPAPRGNA